MPLSGMYVCKVSKNISVLASEGLNVGLVLNPKSNISVSSRSRGNLGRSRSCRRQKARSLRLHRLVSAHGIESSGTSCHSCGFITSSSEVVMDVVRDAQQSAGLGACACTTRLVDIARASVELLSLLSDRRDGENVQQVYLTDL